MKAIVFDRYGPPDVLRLEDVADPVPKDDEVLVAVRAASVNPYDWHFMTGLPYLMRLRFGLRKPAFNRIGADLAGIVQAIGRGVTRFRPGDEVFGEVNGESPGHPVLELGSCAEFVCVAEDWLAPKPENMTFEEAAAVPLAATTALQGLRDYGRVAPGDKVLINGASGGVGTFAVQIAKAFGAEVTGVCSTRNLEMVQSLGAAHVVDYTREDFTRRAERYDLLLDNVGNRSLRESRQVLTPSGTYLASFGRPEHRWVGPMLTLLAMKLHNRVASQDLVDLAQHRKADDIDVLADLINHEKLRSVIDRTFPLVEVAEAMRHLEAGHARGKVVVTV